MQIINVMAASLDGRIASHAGEADGSRRALGFTNDDDHQHLLDLIQTADAIIVGRSSIEASGGAFVGRNAKGNYPIWAVLTNGGISPQSRFLEQRELDRWLVSRAPLPELPAEATLRNIVTGERCAAEVVVEALAMAGVERVLLFGGSEINRLFYNAGLVDQLILTVCPLILGSPAAIPLVAQPLDNPVNLVLLASHPKGNLVFLTYKVRKN